MKIKAFFYYSFIWANGYSPLQNGMQFIVSITHKSISPLWGSALMLTLSGVYTPAYGHSVPTGLPQQQLNQP
jgi:hypothetical protein